MDAVASGTTTAGPGCNITCDAGATSEGESDCGAASNGGDGTDQVNGGCSFNPFSIFSSMTCGQTYCGTTGSAGSFRDNDWYHFSLAGRAAVRIAGRTEFTGGILLYATDGTCGALGFPIFLETTPCTDVVFDICLQAGHYFLRVRPDVPPGVGCGSEYNLTLSCDVSDPTGLCRGACLNTADCTCVDDVVSSACSGPNQQLQLQTRCCEIECRPPGPVYDALNMELLSQISLAAFPSEPGSANDCWGFTSPIGRKYAVVGLSESTAFVDITEPRNPVIVAEIPDSPSFWSDMKVYWPYVYNGNESSGGIQVIDVSLIDPPMRTVTLVREVTTSGLDTTHTISVNPESGYLYLNGSNLGAGELAVLSLADPSNPQLVAQVSDGVYVHDSQIVTYPTIPAGPFAGHEIAFCYSGQSGLRIFDVTDKSNMTLLSTLTYPTLAYNHQGWLSLDRNYVYFNDELEELGQEVSHTTVYVADVQNLLAPFLATTFTHPTGCWIDHDLMVRGNRVYQAQYSAGIHVMDISDPMNPNEIAYFDSRPEDNDQDFLGMWGLYADFPTRVVIGSDIERGLFTVCDDPQRPIAGFVLDRAQAACGETITFSAASTTHCSPGGNIVSYEWDFDYDGLSFTTGGIGITVQHFYSTPGVYSIALRATDGDVPSHSDVSTFTVRIGNDCFGDKTPDTCQACTDLCGAGNSNDCCSANAAPGCSSAGCCQTVCSAHPECCGSASGVWDAQCAEWAETLCLAECGLAAPAPDPNGGKTRYLSFSVPPPTVAGPSAGPTAVRVTMVDLQNPQPPNASCCPPPNFSAYESATCTATGELAGCARWVGSPATFLEHQDQTAGATFRGARLQCTPYYHPWDTEGLVHVTGAEVTPSSAYDLENFAFTCQGDEDICVNRSVAVRMYTRRAGDLVGAFNPPTPGTQPDGLDVVAALNAFRGLGGITPGVPRKAGAQLQPNLPELNADINALDIVAVVDYFKGFAYPFTGPCPCPSQVACTATPCSQPSNCPTGLCVRKCSGGLNDGQTCLHSGNCRHCEGGANDGLPCNHPLFCPGGSCPTGPVCGPAGFCHDRCGRCTP